MALESMSVGGRGGDRASQGARVRADTRPRGLGTLKHAAGAETEVPTTMCYIGGSGAACCWRDVYAFLSYSNRLSYTCYKRMSDGSAQIDDLFYSKGLSLRNQPKEIQRWIQAQFQTAKQKLLCDYL